MEEISAPISIRGLKEAIPTLPKVNIEKRSGSVFCILESVSGWLLDDGNPLSGKGECKEQAIVDLYRNIKHLKPEVLE